MPSFDSIWKKIDPEIKGHLDPDESEDAYNRIVGKIKNRVLSSRKLKVFRVLDEPTRTEIGSCWSLDASVLVPNVEKDDFHENLIVTATIQCDDVDLESTITLHVTHEFQACEARDDNLIILKEGSRIFLETVETLGRPKIRNEIHEYKTVSDRH